MYIISIPNFNLTSKQIFYSNSFIFILILEI